MIVIVSVCCRLSKRPSVPMTQSHENKISFFSDSEPSSNSCQICQKDLICSRLFSCFLWVTVPTAALGVRGFVLSWPLDQGGGEATYGELFHALIREICFNADKKVLKRCWSLMFRWLHGKTFGCQEHFSVAFWLLRKVHSLSWFGFNRVCVCQKHS